jgi:hypothetical protein
MIYLHPVLESNFCDGITLMQLRIGFIIFNFVCLMLVSLSSIAALPQICGPGDKTCAVPENLLWACGSVSGLDLYHEQDGTIHGNFFASASCGDNGVQAVLKCSGNSPNLQCLPTYVQSCSGAAPAALATMKVSLIKTVKGTDAQVSGLDSLLGELNPPQPTQPLSFSCRSRKETIRAEVVPRVCRETGSAQPTIVTHYTRGFQFFVLEGSAKGQPVSCRGQMISADAKGASFWLNKTASCPFEFAEVYKDNRVQLSCSSGSCVSQMLTCADQDSTVNETEK